MPQPTGRRVRDAEDARSLLEQIRASGQSPSAWCQAHGVNVRSVYAWRTKLARTRVRNRRSKTESKTAPPPLRFAELISAAPPARYELSLPNGMRLILDEGFTDEAVARLLTLARRC